MKDFLGQELNIGDNVVMIATTYDSRKNLTKAKVIGFSKTMVITSIGNKTSSKILKIDTILNNLNNENK